MKLVTITEAATAVGKSVRSVWRYIDALEADGLHVRYRMPGTSRTLVDLDIVAPHALTRLRGNPNHRRPTRQ